MKHYAKRMLVSFLILSILLSSCKEDEAPDLSVLYGHSVPVGNGTARSFLVFNSIGQPQSLGISLSKEAVVNLPTGEEHGHGNKAHVHSYSYEIPMPEGSMLIPFKQIILDWNPQGHEPEKIYTKPHFDVHFYMMEKQERLQITADDPKMEIVPPQTHIPQGYIAIPGGVPQMGKHWIDPASEEFNGKEFSQTFLFGSYNGEITFYEPMITLAYLQSECNFRSLIKQPAQVAKKGLFYPTQYEIKQEEASGEYKIILNEFTLK